jgi:hypothetical protein
MPLPENFSHTDHFQDVNKRLWNKIVRDYFKDITTADDNLDLTTSRQALLRACLHDSNDSINLTIGRMLLFLFGTTYVKDQYPIVAGDLLEVVEGKRRFHPRITLYFRQDALDAEVGYQTVPLEISWRIMDETHQTITKTKLTTIAQQIKTRFGSGSGYLFRKGRKLIRYFDEDNGYEFKILARETTDAKNLIQEILAINGHSYQSELLKTSTTESEVDAYPSNPGTQVILGKRKNKPRQRPIADVRFRYAYALVQGYNQPIYLYSRTHYHPDALVNDFG